MQGKASGNNTCAINHVFVDCNKATACWHGDNETVGPSSLPANGAGCSRSRMRHEHHRGDEIDAVRHQKASEDRELHEGQNYDCEVATMNRSKTPP